MVIGSLKKGLQGKPLFREPLPQLSLDWIAKVLRQVVKPEPAGPLLTCMRLSAHHFNAHFEGNLLPIEGLPDQICLDTSHRLYAPHSHWTSIQLPSDMNTMTWGLSWKQIHPSSPDTSCLYSYPYRSTGRCSKWSTQPRKLSFTKRLSTTAGTLVSDEGYGSFLICRSPKQQCLQKPLRTEVQADKVLSLSKHHTRLALKSTRFFSLKSVRAWREYQLPATRTSPGSRRTLSEREEPSRAFSNVSASSWSAWVSQTRLSMRQRMDPSSRKIADGGDTAGTVADWNTSGTAQRQTLCFIRAIASSPRHFWAISLASSTLNNRLFPPSSAGVSQARTKRRSGWWWYCESVWNPAKRRVWPCPIGSEDDEGGEDWSSEPFLSIRHS